PPCSSTPRPAASPPAKRVLPEPSPPLSTITSPGRTSAARRPATATVSASTGQTTLSSTASPGMARGQEAPGPTPAASRDEARVRRRRRAWSASGRSLVASGRRPATRHGEHQGGDVAQLVDDRRAATESGGRMEGGDQRRAQPPRIGGTAETGYAGGGVEEQLGREVPEGHHHLGTYQSDLLAEVPLAGID